MKPAITHRGKEIAGDPFISEPASDESGDSQHCGDEDEDGKSTESETESDNAEGSRPERNDSRARNALLREVRIIVVHLFIVTTITDILQCIKWSDDERQERSYQELPIVIRGQIPYFDDITDDSVMMEDSPTPHQARVAFRQVINTGKAFVSQF